ncbi:MAG: hypothetical protein HY741_20170 [Chloroflexi bacterium]|nr:hypothetical protein [Chloroflexota bacterium]
MNATKCAQGIAVAHATLAFSSRFRAWFPPTLLFCAALVVVWQYNPLHRTLTEDPGIFAYISQLVADGLAPHQYAFNEQSSLTFMLGGAAMRLGDLIGLHRLLAFRAASLLLFAVTVVLTYFVGLGFTRARIVGLLAGAILIGFEGYGVRAATTLEPKATMLVFGLACVWALQKRKWFWAGAFAGAAGLAWQIAWGYLIVALLLACVQSGSTFRARARGVGLTLGAALCVFGVYALYFVAHNAQVEMFQQTFLSPLLMHAVGGRTMLARVVQLGRTFVVGYRSHVGFGVLGATGFVLWLGAHWRPWDIRKFFRRAFYFLFQNRRTAGGLLVVFGFGLYSFIDFQNYPDWFPLLPHLSMFAAWVLWQLAARVIQFFKVSPETARASYVALALGVLVLSAAHAFLSPPPERRMKGITWEMQQRAADELNQSLGPDAAVWMIGKADLLFFMRRQNLNKYIYLIGNVDAAADTFEAGGFQQMFSDALGQKPVLYVLARLQKRKFTSLANYRLVERSTQEFVPLRHCKSIRSGRFFVRPDLADALFPANAKGCVRR